LALSASDEEISGSLQPAFARLEGAGFHCWPSESLAVAYCPDRASTHLIDEAARAVLASFDESKQITPRSLAQSLNCESPEESLELERNIHQMMLSLVNLGLLRQIK
jgi:hypothetical protein